MKVTILHGSPKAGDSVSLQYFLYIRRKFPEHEYSVFHIGREAGRLENDPAAFERVMEAVRESQVILFVTPVFYFLVPAPLKRFIEMLFERGPAEIWEGKYVSAVTTSARLSDQTAHNYLRAVCEDLGAMYLDGYSAMVNDLMSGRERHRLSLFAAQLFYLAETDAYLEKEYPPLPAELPVVIPRDLDPVERSRDWKTLLITDAGPDEGNLAAMIELFKDSWPAPVEEVNLRDLTLGGCQSCLRCTYDGACVQSDDGRELYQDKLMSAQALVYAGSVRDRYLSARWKNFFDRSFVYGHRPVLRGKQGVFLVSGPLGSLANLRMIFRQYAEAFGLNLVGLVSDDQGDSAATARAVKGLAERMDWALEHGYARPHTFLGEGTHKIMRDLAFIARFFWKANHRYYRAHGLYDFPQKMIPPRIMNALFTPLLAWPGFRKKLYGGLNKQMASPLRRHTGDPPA